MGLVLNAIKENSHYQSPLSWNINHNLSFKIKPKIAKQHYLEMSIITMIIANQFEKFDLPKKYKCPVCSRSIFPIKIEVIVWT